MSKHVLISGAAGGLGLAVTQAFLKAQHTVTALTQPGHPDQATRLQGLEQQPNQLHIFDLDQGNQEAVKAFFAQHKAHLANLSSQVLLVGGFDMTPFEDITQEHLQAQINLNLYTAFFMAQAAYGVMQAHNQGGRMVLVGARPALQAEQASAMIPYALAKGGVIQLTEILSAMGKPHHIQAHALVPSIIDTAANRQAMPNANFNEWPKPAQIAQTVLNACQDPLLNHSLLKVYGTT